MSDAVRQGRPALLQAIERALDGMNEKVTAGELGRRRGRTGHEEANGVLTTAIIGRHPDFQRRDEEWRQRYNKLRADSQASQGQMESEMSQLRSQVATLTASLQRSEAARNATHQSGPDTAGGDNSQESMSELVQELQEALEKSHMRHAVAKSQLEEVVALVRKRKAETLRWVEYADSLEVKIKKLEKKLAAARQTAVPVEDRTSTPETLDMVEKTLPQPQPQPQPQAEVTKPTLSASFTSSETSSFLGHPTADDDGAEPELPPQKVPKRTRADGANNETVPDSAQSEPSSDAAQPDLPDLPELPTPRATNSDGVAGHVAIKNEPSSDGPEIIWERVTKKPKKGANDRSNDRQTPQILPAVKRESSDNTPRALGLAHYRESQESIDLDEGQLTVQTPRKRHLFYQQQLLLERDNSDESSPATSQEKPADEPGAQVSRDAEDSKPATVARSLVPQPPPLARPLPCTPSTPLAPISGNVRRGPKDPVKGLKSLKRGIESLAEDNQAYDSPSVASKRTAMEPPSTTRQNRLRSLLNSRPSEPSPVSSSLPRPTAAPRSHGGTDSPTAGLFGRPPPTRKLPHLRDDDNVSLPRTPSAAPARHAGTPAAAGLATPTTNPLTAALLAAKAESTAKKVSSPLRGRPVDRLKMDDFKINPAFNNGETFAYNEVVRGRADRAGLSGCTDPQCCGKAFRSMATSELDAAGPAHLRRPECLVLMERHLGDGAYMLAQMSPEEKKALWLEARTKELADKYGKHRHRFHRRASPPGFWDTDFPTTQDEEHNRAEADKVERITVQERYREAMRSGGGRWMFRDE
ncbi:hypothetical protein HMPREF1624_04598 [Sporothrix schenckii ATCC 58251]|uniref:DNA endonuclease activator Ctp1 C-terminal domain-containing protein n=1 Tax=Sporothrix schenckii (strain ATCC 58251 / de Perez 2211183) TaxID=1391915 RepID=U7PUW0_SPOS1|nr:hypothetical protein HMPREF1624_04598 [Sporothrix schenckii ATCC 58251]